MEAVGLLLVGVVIYIVLSRALKIRSQEAKDALNNPADDGLFCYGALLQVFSHRL